MLAVVAVLGFVGFEFGAGLGEEARSPRRTIPAATYLALGVIAVVYAGASWAMAAHYGTRHVAAAAGKLGPGLLFTLGGSGWLAQAAQLLFMTSLFAAALAFHNVVWRSGSRGALLRPAPSEPDVPVSLHPAQASPVRRRWRCRSAGSLPLPAAC